MNDIFAHNYTSYNCQTAMASSTHDLPSNSYHVAIIAVAVLVMSVYKLVS